MPDETYDSVIPRPADPPLKYDGRKLTPKRIVETVLRAAKDMEPFTKEVCRARDFRRGTLVRKIAESWALRNPEAALAAPAKLHQRRTLEQDLKARIGAVEPTYIRKALGDLKGDAVLAEESQDYLNEWRTSVFGVPFDAFINKLTEDGAFARIRLPAMADRDGCPDFFEQLSERAHSALSDDEQRSYQRDDKLSKRRPYVKVDADGNRVLRKRYAQIEAAPNDEADEPKTMKRADRAKARRAKAMDAHKDDVQRYLLQRPASTVQVIGGLDAFPVFKRGTGREQSDVAAICTRQLVSVEEAFAAEYGWKGMNGRLLVPKAYSESNTVGRDGCYYLYAIYFTSLDEDKHERPIIVYTLGGYATSVDGSEPTDKDAVGLIDLYKEFGLEGPLWSWHWGLQTQDDEPSYRGRPYLSDLIDLMLAIEGEEMAIRATANVNSFTGHIEQLDGALRGPEAASVLEAVLEGGPNAKSLKKQKIPKPGDIETAIGQVEPFQQAKIGEDAWRILASDRMSLSEATAVDQAASAPGSSGRAIVVGETLAKQAKSDIRKSALEAARRDGEDQMKILYALSQPPFSINWPIQKVEEPPAGDVTGTSERYTVAEFNPDWMGEDGQFTRLHADYPEELNLAALDLEAGLAERGFSHFENVMRKKGITDVEAEWQKVIEWKMRGREQYIATIEMRLAQRRGDKTMVDVLKRLQADQKMTTAGVPGAQNGVPTSALRRMGEGGSSGGQTAVSASRGGDKAATMGTAQQNQEGMDRMLVGQGAA